MVPLSSCAWGRSARHPAEKNHTHNWCKDVQRSETERRRGERRERREGGKEGRRGERRERREGGKEGRRGEKDERRRREGGKSRK